MGGANIGAAEWNPPPMEAPCLPTLKLIFSFPSAIPGMNVGKLESWVNFTLMTVTTRKGPVRENKEPRQKVF